MKNLLFDDFDFYIIHTKNYRERYDHLKTEFQKLNIDIEKNKRIHFIDGIIPDTQLHYKRKGRYGICLSHFSAIKQSLTNDNPYVLILEDDVVFLDNFIDNFNLTFYNLNKNDENYDIVQFRTPRYPCNGIHCKLIDNYITGHCRFVPTECIYLTEQIRQKIAGSPEWFFTGPAIDVWYTKNLRCIKTITNYTSQNKALASISWIHK